jgi:hypothetical protein
MSNKNYRLIDQEILDQVISDLNEIKQHVQKEKDHVTNDSETEGPMDSADVLNYLHICRRTLTKYKKQGLPKHGTGKPLFWKHEIDAFIKQKNSSNGN